MPVSVLSPTLLVITPVDAAALGLSPYGARGLTQSLDVEDQATAVRRTINGEAINLAYPAFQKYRSTITCTDQDTPCLDGAWLGQTVAVDCVVELSYTSGTPGRPAVSGSTHTDATTGITYYQPSLTMMVAAIRSSLAEYPAEYSWQIDLVEV